MGEGRKIKRWRRRLFQMCYGKYMDIVIIISQPSALLHGSDFRKYSKVLFVLRAEE